MIACIAYKSRKIYLEEYKPLVVHLVSTYKTLVKSYKAGLQLSIHTNGIDGSFTSAVKAYILLPVKLVQ
jgi:hypothetical protein